MLRVSCPSLLREKEPERKLANSRSENSVVKNWNNHYQSSYCNNYCNVKPLATKAGVTIFELVPKSQMRWMDVMYKNICSC